jgi:deoxyribonuclease (pyrimidine dimer)
MTRINADLDPKILSDQHLMAEYREMPMVTASLRRSLKSKTPEQVLANIPSHFCLGQGHVYFWYNKLWFLKKRYTRLINELIRRGYNLNPERYSLDTMGFPAGFHNDYKMTETDESLILARINERIALKPEWYRYSG